MHKKFLRTSTALVAFSLVAINLMTSTVNAMDPPKCEDENNPGRKSPGLLVPSNPTAKKAPRNIDPDKERNWQYEQNERKENLRREENHLNRWRLEQKETAAEIAAEKLRGITRPPHVMSRQDTWKPTTNALSPEYADPNRDEFYSIFDIREHWGVRIVGFVHSIHKETFFSWERQFDYPNVLELIKEHENKRTAAIIYQTAHEQEEADKWDRDHPTYKPNTVEKFVQACSMM